MLTMGNCTKFLSIRNEIFWGGEYDMNCVLLLTPCSFVVRYQSLG